MQRVDACFQAVVARALLRREFASEQVHVLVGVHFEIEEMLDPLIDEKLVAFTANRVLAALHAEVRRKCIGINRIANGFAAGISV